MIPGTWAGFAKCKARSFASRYNLYGKQGMYGFSISSAREIVVSGMQAPVRSDGDSKRVREAYMLMLLRGTGRPGLLAFGEEAVPGVCRQRHQRPNVHFSASLCTTAGKRSCTTSNVCARRSRDTKEVERMACFIKRRLTELGWGGGFGVLRLPGWAALRLRLVSVCRRADLIDSSDDLWTLAIV